MFSRCCECRNTQEYAIVHDPKPIVLPDNMRSVIKELLWYVPNIDSYQAGSNDLISDNLYSDFSFSYVMKYMGIDEDRDVKWIEPKGEFDVDDWNYYSGDICTNCQKIIIRRCKSLTKLNDLLRCVRNCIAHGYFAIVDNYLIGFNTSTSKKRNDVGKNAIIKIVPHKLLNAIKSLISPMGKTKLVGYAFRRIGYSVSEEYKTNNYRVDLLVEKENRKYAIEIKDYRGKTYLHPEELKSFLTNSSTMLDVERVLLIDTSRVVKKVREMESKIENFRIVDIEQIKELLKDEPRDILLTHCNE